MSDRTDTIWFAPDDDPHELVKALEAEGYAVRIEQGSGDVGGAEPGDTFTVLTVQPFDDGVEALVDVYGGWLPGDERLRPTDGSAGSPPAGA